MADSLEQVIADYDRQHPFRGENHYDRRLRERREAEERQQRSKAQEAARNQESWNSWYATEFEKHLVAHMREGGLICDVVARALAMEKRDLRRDYEQKIDELQKRIKQLEERNALDARFSELEARLAGRH